MGPLFVQKHKFLQWIRSTFMSMFQKPCFYQCFRVSHRPRSNRNITLFKNISVYNEFWATFQKHQFLQHIMSLLQQGLWCLAGLAGLLLLLLKTTTTVDQEFKTTTNVVIAKFPRHFPAPEFPLGWLSWFEHRSKTLGFSRFWTKIAKKT